jgi:hypothetical protein
MSIDWQAVRDELAELPALAVALPGWERYSTIPGHASLPALVVGLPERIEPGQMWACRLPVYVLTRSADPAAAETAILTAAMAAAEVYRAAGPGTTYRSCRVAELSEFVLLEVGTVEADAATVYLELLVPTT